VLDAVSRQVVRTGSGGVIRGISRDTIKNVFGARPLGFARQRSPVTGVSAAGVGRIVTNNRSQPGSLAGPSHGQWGRTFTWGHQRSTGGDITENCPEAVGDQCRVELLDGEFAGGLAERTASFRVCQ